MAAGAVLDIARRIRKSDKGFYARESEGPLSDDMRMSAAAALNGVVMVNFIRTASRS